MFERVSDRTTLSEKIVAQVREAVLQGRLRPGDRLAPERELAKRFGVSRTAIRDAIKVLAGIGVVSVRHGVGAFIADPVAEGLGSVAARLPIRHETIRNLFEIRKTVETAAAGWAADRAEKGQRERLLHLATHSLHAITTNPENLEKIAASDAEFHVAVAEATNNPLLVRLMLHLLDVLAESRAASLRIPGRPRRSIEQHLAIARAITRRDAAAARAAMLEHLTEVEAAITTRLHADEEERP